MPEVHEDSNAYKLQSLEQQMSILREKRENAKRDIIFLKAKRDALVALVPTIEAEGKALATELRAFVGVPSGTIARAQVIAKAITIDRDPTNTKVDGFVARINSMVTFYEELM